MCRNIYVPVLRVSAPPNGMVLYTIVPRSSSTINSSGSTTISTTALHYVAT